MATLFPTGNPHDVLAASAQAAAEVEAQQAPAIPGSQLETNATRQFVVDMIGKVKYPAVMLKLDDTQPTVNYPDQLALCPAQGNTKHPGTVNIKSGNSYSAAWYGRIERDGRISWSALAKKGSCLWRIAAHEAIVAFGRDPADAAKHYGDETWHCCFCNRELTHPNSVHHGYGPVCADKYGLPWDAPVAAGNKVAKQPKATMPSMDDPALAALPVMATVDSAVASPSVPAGSASPEPPPPGAVHASEPQAALPLPSYGILELEPFEPAEIASQSATPKPHEPPGFARDWQNDARIAWSDPLAPSILSAVELILSRAHDLDDARATLAKWKKENNL